MKIKLLFAAAVMMVVCVPATAIDIDITNNPDKDYMLGYKHSYPKDCDVNWWASRWETVHIIALGECKGISEKKVMNDLNDLMAATKKYYSRFKNFSEYFRWKDELTEKINREERVKASKKENSGKPNNRTFNLTVHMPMPTKAEQLDMMRSYFCIDTEEGTYFFSEIRKPSDPKWRKVAPKGWKVGDAYSGEWIAFQTSTKRDLSVLASIDGWTVSIPMKAAYACSWMH